MKRLIVCCDGTWQKADQTWLGEDSPTNVARIAQRIAKVDGAVPQVVWYDQGVGTGNFIDMLRGGLSGEGLDLNIAEAYRFIVTNYSLGDELYLFGFSRGAYTVRSLAGMIRKCGIIRRDKVQNYAKVMDLYRDNHHPDDPVPARFRAENSIAGAAAIPIKMIGVWDTVGALGIPLFGLSALTERKYEFHDTELSGTVEYAYQALAIDEGRKPFTPTLWKAIPKPGQTVEQVWFCGSHSDIGGGSGSRELPDIALQWMIEKARVAGLAFDPAVEAALPLKKNALAPMNLVERGMAWLVPGERPIGLLKEQSADPTQSLHPTPFERWDGDETYRPANLRAYFSRTGNKRAADSSPTLLAWLSRMRAW